MGRAAERLHRTQPALTSCVRRLEEACGATLFERTGRGIRLTSAGKALYPQLLQAKETVQAQFLRGFGKAEVQTLESLLNRMLDNR